MDIIAVKLLVIICLLYIPYYIVGKKFNNWLVNKFFKRIKNEDND